MDEQCEELRKKLQVYEQQLSHRLTQQETSLDDGTTFLTNRKNSIPVLHVNS